MASEATLVFRLIADNGENSIWKIMFHEGDWASAHEKSAHGTMVEGSTSGLVHEGCILTVKLCRRDQHPLCQILLQKACLPQDRLHWKQKHRWLASTIKQLTGMTWLGKILSEVLSALPEQSQLVWTNLITCLFLIKCQHPRWESFVPQREDVAGCCRVRIKL